jgi:hypothetical protein
MTFPAASDRLQCLTLFCEGMTGSQEDQATVILAS